MKFEFKSRFAASVIFTQEIHDNTTAELQCKVALELAVMSGANLRDAYLRDAYLRDAYLSGANLQQFKQDFIAEVLKLPNELDAPRATITEGKIDGSTYSGECACLAGTLAKAFYGKDLEGDYHGEDIEVNGFAFTADVGTPREQWFLQIKPGDTPETNSAAKTALQWLDEAIAIRNHIRKAA